MRLVLYRIAFFFFMHDGNGMSKMQIMDEEIISYYFLLIHGIVFGIPTECDLVQTLSSPRIESTVFDEVGAWSVGLDGPKGQNGSDSTLDSAGN